MSDEKGAWRESDRRLSIDGLDAQLGSLARSNSSFSQWKARTAQRNIFWEQMTLIEPPEKPRKIVFWRTLRPVLERLYREGISPSQSDFEKAIKSTDIARKKARAATRAIQTTLKYLEVVKRQSIISVGRSELQALIETFEGSVLNISVTLDEISKFRHPGGRKEIDLAEASAVKRAYDFFKLYIGKDEIRIVALRDFLFIPSKSRKIGGVKMATPARLVANATWAIGLLNSISEKAVKNRCSRMELGVKKV